MKYLLSVNCYSGTAGDSLTAHHSGYEFSTYDQGNDMNTVNCAELYKGVWWYNKYNCHRSNLNGYYCGGPHASFADAVNGKAF